MNTTSTPRPRPIEARGHAIIDYGLCALLATGPVLLGLDRRARTAWLTALARWPRPTR